MNGPSKLHAAISSKPFLAQNLVLNGKKCIVFVATKLESVIVATAPYFEHTAPLTNSLCIKLYSTQQRLLT